MRQLLPLIGVLLFTGCTGGKPPEEKHSMPPPHVGVATPIMREEATYRTLTGAIEAVHTVQLNPQVSGLVTKVHVADGAMVKVGDPILDIDPAPYLATIARVTADIQRAESRVHVASLQVERSKTLIADKVISRQQLEQHESELLVAQADVAAAKAAMKIAQLDLGYTKVTSPIAGRIGKILTTLGNLVQGGGPVPPTYITTIVSIDPVYVTFDLDEATWNTISGALLAATTDGEAVPVNIGLSGDSDYPYSGQVTSIDNKIDQGSGSIRIRAAIPNPNQTLTPGAFARVQLQVAAEKPVMLIHERTLKSQFNTRFVYVLDADNAATIRPVQLGDAIGDKRIVIDGLLATDRIVVMGQAKIFMPGMSVTPKPASMETATMIVEDQSSTETPSGDAAAATKGK